MMAGNPWQPYHDQNSQRFQTHEEDRECKALHTTEGFRQVENLQLGGQESRDPCLIGDGGDDQVQSDNRSSQTELQNPQMQHHLVENERQQLAGSERDGLTPRNRRHVDLNQIVRSESFIDRHQVHELQAPHVPEQPETVTTLVPEQPETLTTHHFNRQTVHGSNNGNHGQTPSLSNSRQVPNACRGSTRIDISLLTDRSHVQDEQPEVVVDEFIVPILPIPVAIAFCLMNFAAPGIGTIVAGMCMPCCGDAVEMSRRQKLCSGAAVVGVGFLQLLLTACFLVGWIWSVIWGLSLVGTSLDYYEKPREISSWRNRVSSARAQSDSTCSCFTRPLGSGRRRPRSNFIYPMRAPSDIDRDSPPPPYVMFATPPPSYSPPAPTDGLTNTAEQPPTQDLQETNEVPNISSATRCNVCQKDFVTEEHRFSCRRCSDIVCRHCYTKRIPFQGGESCIVCDVCYSEHLEMEAEMQDHI